MAAVYDDQSAGDTGNSGKSRKDIQRATGNDAASKAELARLTGSDAAANADLRHSTGADEKASLGDQKPEGDTGSGGGKIRFRKENLKGLSNLRTKPKKWMKNKWVVGGAGGGSLILMAILGMLFILGQLLIPNFTQNMIAYSFARISRETVDSSTKITAESVTIDSSTDAAYSQAASTFGNEVDATTKTNIWDTINKYRPEKVVDNMRASGQIYFEYGPDKSLNPLKKLTGRQTMQKIYVDGNEIDIPQNSMSTFDKILNPIDYVKGRWTSNRLLKTSLADSMDTTLRGTNWLLRSKAAGVIRNLYDLKLYRWDKEQLNQLDQETPEQADVTNQQEEYENITDSGAAATEAEAGSVGDTQQAETDANSAIDTCMQDTKCTEGVINEGGGLPETAIVALNNDLNTTIWDSILKWLAPTYAIAAPLCMIWSASIVNSGGVINANQGELERTAYQVTSAADQQKYGNVNGNAIGAQARQMGDNSEVANSNVMKRASGIPIDTTQSGIDPQSSAGGTYTYDVFSFLGPVDNVIRPIIGTVCSIFDNPYTGLAIGLFSLIVPAVKAAITSAADGAAAAIGAFVGKLATGLWGTMKNFIKPAELAKLGGIAGATIAGSLLAKYIAMQHIGAVNNGTSRNLDFDNRAEAGAIANAQDVDRQQNMAGPMTAAGTAQTDVQNQSFLNGEEQQQSTFQRYFAVTNANSFITRLGVQAWAHMNLSAIPSLVLSAGRIFNPVSAFSSIFSLMQNKTMAAAAATTDTTDYNEIQFGWTPIEEWHYENDPSYSMLENQKILDQSGQEQTISTTYDMCFTEKIGTLLAAGDLQRDQNANIITNVGTCAPDNYSPTNRDDPIQTDNMVFASTQAQLAFRWRVAIRDQTVMGQLLDTQNATVTNQ